MNLAILETWAENPWVVALGWTLLHLIWQATLIGLVGCAILYALRRSSASLRYGVACLGLLSMAVAPVGTLVWLRVRAPQTLEVAEPVSWAQMQVPPAQVAERSAALLYAETPKAKLADPQLTGEGPSSLQRRVRSWLPIGVALWMIGVTLLAMRLLLGLRRVWSWKRAGTQVTDSQWVRVTQRLRRSMGIRRSVRLLQSSRAAVPAVIGVLRPAILVPIGLLSGLTPAQVETILAHELAHIRRHDYLVNLLQTALETLLFYHPAVWWISKRIRIERENHCDDLAIEACGDRLVLAQALARLEEFRSQAPRLAPAADGASLVHRIRRIVSIGDPQPEPKGIAGALALGALALLIPGLWLTLTPNAPANESSPISQQIRVDSTNPNLPTSRLGRKGTRLLATQEYTSPARTSTGWVLVDGVQLPVDVGVEHQGLVVYKTLMEDIVAVDKATSKALWKYDWSKTMPLWQTVSIVEWQRAELSETVVELFAQDAKSGRLVYEYHSLGTGEMLEPPSTVEPMVHLDFRMLQSDRHAVIQALPQGRSLEDLVRHFASGMTDRSKFLEYRSITNMESLVTAEKPNYVFEMGMEAPEVYFNLPEGSGMRAEFRGERVEIQRGISTATVVITNGTLELIDSIGVFRARASADGGAEQLVVVCRESLGEIVMVMHTRRIEPSPEYPNPPVQVALNVQTGAPANEVEPPHGAIRYEVLPWDPKGTEPMRMKMKWRYELDRLLDEAVLQSGKSAEQLLSMEAKGTTEGAPIQQPIQQVAPPQTLQPAAPIPQAQALSDEGWGDVFAEGGLRARLSVTTLHPTVGQPLLIKLEIKNFGEAPRTVDTESFRASQQLAVWALDNQDFRHIGPSPKRSKNEQTVPPGSVLTVWQDVDVTQLFAMAPGRYGFYICGEEVSAALPRQISNSVYVDMAPPEKPWSATGVVKDASGQPLVGASVIAHCGMGTLFRTGSTLTDEHGRYHLLFGPGLFAKNPRTEQVALISVELGGYYEASFGRIGQRMAALSRSPDAAEGLFVMGETQHIDFVMRRPSSLRGTVYYADGLPATGLRLSLVGEDYVHDLERVVAEDGTFSFAEVPTGLALQLKFDSCAPESKTPIKSWATPPMEFFDSRDSYQLPASIIDLDESEDGIPELDIVLETPGAEPGAVLRAQQKQGHLFFGTGSYSQEPGGIQGRLASQARLRL